MEDLDKSLDILKTYAEGACGRLMFHYALLSMAVLTGNKDFSVKCVDILRKDVGYAVSALKNPDGTAFLFGKKVDIKSIKSFARDTLNWAKYMHTKTSCYESAFSMMVSDAVAVFSLGEKEAHRSMSKEEIDKNEVKAYDDKTASDEESLKYVENELKNLLTVVDNIGKFIASETYKAESDAIVKKMRDAQKDETEFKANPDSLLLPESYYASKIASSTSVPSSVTNLNLTLN
jgi:hypothetical protein